MNARPMLPAVLMLVVGALAAADNPIPMEVELKDVDPAGETYAEPEAKTTALCVDGCVRVVTKYHKGPTGMASWLEVVPGERTDIIEWAPLAPGQLAPGWVSGPVEDTTAHAFTAKVTGETRIRVEGIIAGQRTYSPTTWTVKAVAAKVSPQVLVLSGTQEARVEAELDGPAISDADLRWTLMGSGANLQPGTPQTGRHVDYRSADSALGTRTIALRIGNVGQHVCATAEAHVVKIAFDADPGQNYGFDECADDRDEYLSCKRDAKTTFQITVSNWSDKLKNRIFLKSRDGHFKITGASGDGSLPLTQATTVVEIEGLVPGVISQSDELGVHLNSPDTASVIDLHVKLYKEKEVAKASIFLIHDPGSPQTNTPALSFSQAGFMSRADEVLKQAVVKLLTCEVEVKGINSWDVAPRNGDLDWYYDGGSQPEHSVIAAGLPSADPRMAFVNRVNAAYRPTITSGNTTASVTFQGVSYINAWKAAPWRFGSGSPGTPVTITSVVGNVVHFGGTGLPSVPTAGDVLWTPILAGVGADPQIGELNGNEIDIGLHEMLHRTTMGRLLDVVKRENIMYWAAGGGSGGRLRYRPQQLKYSGGTEKQWDGIDNR